MIVNLKLSPKLEAIGKIAQTKGAGFSLNGDEIISWTKGDKPTEEEIQSKIDSVAYARNRQAEYPAIAEQLDEIFHNGIDSWKAVIKVTKDKYPK
jgi:hypothetical protein